jgi:hypothetical protein
MSRLVLVVGVGRSGTSLFTGILGQLGYHVPQPEVAADSTNPRGFSEPRWVVDFHTELLRARRVTVNDSRPKAFEKTAETDEATYDELRNWLDGQLGAADAVVVKDPRTGWFLPLWTRAAAGADLSFVTMLRHPAEIVASATRSYGEWQTPASRVAAWVNLTLETERATRGSKRAFVRYEDLLEDWPREVRRVGGLIESPKLAAVEHNPEVDAFVDPSLHRNRIVWEELDVPASIRDLAEDVWQRLQPLARGDRADAQLDEARAAYGALYAEAEAIAQSSITAAKPRKRPAKPQPSAPPSLKARLARRAAGALRRS